MKLFSQKPQSHLSRDVLAWHVRHRRWSEGTRGPVPRTVWPGDPDAHQPLMRTAYSGHLLPEAFIRRILHLGLRPLGHSRPEFAGVFHADDVTGHSTTDLRLSWHEAANGRFHRDGWGQPILLYTTDGISCPGVVFRTVAQQVFAHALHDSPLPSHLDASTWVAFREATYVGLGLADERLLDPELDARARAHLALARLVSLGGAVNRWQQAWTPFHNRDIRLAVADALRCLGANADLVDNPSRTSRAA